jgi:hypothetical protein
MEPIATGPAHDNVAVASMASLSPIEKDAPAMAGVKDQAPANAPSPPNSEPEQAAPIAPASSNADAPGEKMAKTNGNALANEASKTDASGLAAEKESAPEKPTESSVPEKPTESSAPAATEGSVQTEMLKEQLPEATDPGEGADAARAAMMSGALPQLSIADATPVAEMDVDDKKAEPAKDVVGDAPKEAAGATADPMAVDAPAAEKASEVALPAKEDESKDDASKAEAAAPEATLAPIAEETASTTTTTTTPAPIDAAKAPEPPASASKKRKADDMAVDDDQDAAAADDGDEAGGAKKVKKNDGVAAKAAAATKRATAKARKLATPVGQSMRKTRSQGPV